MTHTTNDLLDILAARHGNCSDYRLAQLLGTSPSNVTHWRKRRAAFSSKAAHRIAALLEWDAAYVLACVELERAARARDKLLAATWRRIAEQFRPQRAARVLTRAARPALTGDTSDRTLRLVSGSD